VPCFQLRSLLINNKYITIKPDRSARYYCAWQQRRTWRRIRCERIWL